MLVVVLFVAFVPDRFHSEETPYTINEMSEQEVKM